LGIVRVRNGDSNVSALEEPLRLRSVPQPAPQQTLAALPPAPECLGGNTIVITQQYPHKRLSSFYLQPGTAQRSLGFNYSV
jgi:hypothetical protein